MIYIYIFASISLNMYIPGDFAYKGDKLDRFQKIKN